jgi:hypothetical protein
MTELLVFTFKDGLLSRVAHDLKIEAERVTVARDGASLTVTAPACGLKVRCAMKKGREDHRALSASQRGEIESLIYEKILDVERHPEIHFTGKIQGASVSGVLTIRGASQALTLPWNSSGGAITGEITIDQRRFGISPYRAMMGAIKLKPTLKIVWRTPVV